MGKKEQSDEIVEDTKKSIRLIFESNMSFGDKSFVASLLTVVSSYAIQFICLTPEKDLSDDFKTALDEVTVNVGKDTPEKPRFTKDGLATGKLKNSVNKTGSGFNLRFIGETSAKECGGKETFPDGKEFRDPIKVNIEGGIYTGPPICERKGEEVRIPIKVKWEELDSDGNFQVSGKIVEALNSEREALKNLGVMTKKSRFEKLIRFFSKDLASRIFAKRCLKIVGEKNE